jgi:transcriptional regulator with XRE-family HTH domain
MMDYPLPGAPFAETLSEMGARARQLRLLQDLTQGELARRAGVGIATVQRFEKTGHASTENALRMASALRAEDGFRRLFEPPRYTSLDEALARPEPSTRKRARKRP